MYIDTAEYQTIRKCTPQLKIAIQHTLTKLSGHLLSGGLITADQGGELRNQMYSESDRAAKLIDFVLNKVELVPRYYKIFISALEEDKLNNEVVIKFLEETRCSLICDGKDCIKFRLCVYHSRSVRPFQHWLVVLLCVICIFVAIDFVGGASGV